MRRLPFLAVVLWLLSGCASNQHRCDRLCEGATPSPVQEAVCGRDGRTYPDETNASIETTVLHGGACGQCSDPQNVEVYRKTSSTLTRYAKECGIVYALFGESVARACFSKVGLTASCTQCWVSNMACTLSHCSGVCLVSTLKGEPYAIDGKLNECLQCDETHCGASFARCAGMNRRRAGIVSDIERPEEQIWVRR